MVAGSRWWPDTRTDWPTDRRSYYNFDFDSHFSDLLGGVEKFGLE
jgi:hypothetical protein